MEQATTNLSSRTPVSEEIITDLHTVYTSISSHGSLAPSPALNQLFSRLVTLCTLALPSSTVDTILASPFLTPHVTHLRTLCSSAESLLERHWALRTTSSQAGPAQFPYYTNYVQLARLEFHALLALCPTPLPRAGGGRLLFLGSGPLPLSATELLGLLGPAWQAWCVDYDPEAVALGCGVAAAVGLAERCHGVVGDARKLDVDVDVDSFDVILLAALVGDKEEVLRALAHRAKTGARVLVRSAHGLRTLLYPEVAEEMVRGAGLCVEGTVHPSGEVVNSVIVATVPERARL